MAVSSHFSSVSIEDNVRRTLPFDLRCTRYLRVKRVIDIVLGGALLIGALPLMILIGIAIKMDTPGSILFIQSRVGSKRRTDDDAAAWEVGTFDFYKFRTMSSLADQSIHEQYIRAFVKGELGLSTQDYKLDNDPRVTRVGRFLRRTSLDELPQLINVLKGQMSLVGPRPVPIYEVLGYEQRHWRRLRAWPGLTGLWQVRGRGQVPFEEMIRLDLEYIEKQSLWLDLKILFATLPAVISARGAK